MKRMKLLLAGLALGLLLAACGLAQEIPVTGTMPGLAASAPTMVKTPGPYVWAPDARQADFADLMRACLLVREEGIRTHGGPEYYLSLGAQKRVMLPEDRNTPWDTPVTRVQALATIARLAGPQEAVNDINHIPDYPAGSPYYESVLAMYRAGIWAGEDSSGTLNPASAVTNGELQEMLDRLTYARERLYVTLESATYRKPIVYGQSGAGRDLVAYRFGQGENVLVLSFAIHGFEDNWDRDGQMLVNTAELLMDALDKHYEALVEGKDWSVYVLPCLNPDGLLDGTTCNGDGRRTTHHYDWDGNLVEGGIDLNRCFPYIFYSRYDSRNYNGPQALSAPEAQALAEFTQGVMGSANNVLIDAHGWYSQIIVSGGWDCPIYRAFEQNFPTCYYTSLYGSAGYYSAWAAYNLGYDAALFEFPHVPTEEVFHNYSLDEKYVESILWLLENYQ